MILEVGAEQSIKPGNAAEGVVWVPDFEPLGSPAWITNDQRI